MMRKNQSVIVRSKKVIHTVQPNFSACQRDIDAVRSSALCHELFIIWSRSY